MQQDRLLALGRVRRYPAQSILFFEGDDAHDVVVVRSGELKVSRTVEGREVLLDVLSGGDVLGELAAIDGWPRSATATALTTAEVSASEARPEAAARRPVGPPARASAPAAASESFEWSAARERRRMARSNAGVEVRAIAA